MPFQHMFHRCYLSRRRRYCEGPVLGYNPVQGEEVKMNPSKVLYVHYEASEVT